MSESLRVGIGREMGDRFQDTQDSQFWPSRDPEYLVTCPKCEAPGVVRRSIGLRCSSCSFVLTATDDRWFGATSGWAGKRCGKCGAAIHRRFDACNGHDTTEIRCEGCKKVNECEIHWTRRLEPGTDPVFGCPLLLRSDFRGRVLWAWNLDHLSFLEDYVGSKLRERIPNQNTSLASRLPKWMKEAKNRESLLREFSAMRERAGP